MTRRRVLGAVAVRQAIGLAGCLLVGGLLTGCNGIFQHRLPAVALDCHHLATGDELRVGAAERDVTPAVGGYLGGFSLARTSSGVASPLKVRALVLELGERRFAIVGVDNLGVMREDVDWIKSGLVGFAGGDVFFCSSHTHAGPDLIGLWGFYFMSSGRDRDYLAQLRAAVVAAVAEARARATPARLVLGSAELPPSGLVKNSKRGEVFDRRVTVLQARSLAGDWPVGTLLHLACHPEVLRRGNTLLSADYVGALCDAWRDAGHGQAVFVSGALGAMVTPGIEHRDVDGMQAMGKQLCELGERALAAAAPLPAAAIEVRRGDVYLPVTTLGFRLGRLTTVVQRQLYGDCAKTSVGWLRIGALEAMAVPGEMEPALAQRIRALAHRPELLVFGLCDDELGYLLRGQDARDPAFAYERSMSPCVDAGELVQAALVGGG